MLPNNRTAFSRLVRMASCLRDTGATPEDIIKSVLARWVHASFPSLSLDCAPSNLFFESPVVKFAEWLGESDLITGAFWLSSAYAALLPDGVRKCSAMYFTPPRLTARLLDSIEARIPIESGPLIDPACGGGAFLAPAAIRIVERLQAQGLDPESILTHLESSIYGCETDEFLCWLSNKFLHLAIAGTIKEAGREPTFSIKNGDGLRLFESYKQKFAVVLCNPPYRKMTKVELQPYLDGYADVLKGQPNLYSLFMRRTIELLRPDGVGALLTPMSFLSGQSFAPVRKILIERGNIRQLDLIHQKEGIFLLADQDTVITTWKNSKGKDGSATTNVFCLDSRGFFSFAGALDLPKNTKPWPVPRNTNDEELSSIFDKAPANFDDYGYRAKTGALVYHRDNRPRFKTREEGTKAKALVPLIWSKNICSNGEFSLERITKNSKEKFIDVGSTDAAGVIRKPSVVIQRVSSAEQPRRLIGAPVPYNLLKEFGGVVGENHVCFLEQIDDNCLIKPELLSHILRTETVDRLFRCISGATNVSVYELQHLPLPDPHRLLDGLAKGLSIEVAVRRAYNLSIQERI